VRDYVDYQRRHRKGAEDTEQKLSAYVLPRLGEKRLADLTAADLDAWLAWALKRRRRTRKKGAEASEMPSSNESKAELAERSRRRRSTLTRVINPFKACLRYAEAAGKPVTPDLWRRLKKFRGVESARLRWLTVSEAQRLQNAA